MKNLRVVSEMMSFLAKHGYSWDDLFRMTKEQIRTAYDKVLIFAGEEEIY